MRRSLALSLLLTSLVATNVFALAEARIAGKIVDVATKNPIATATVVVTSADPAFNYKQEIKVSPKDGSYAIFILDGTKKYRFTFSAPGYAPYEEVIKLNIGIPNTKNVELAPATAAVRNATAPDPAVEAYNEGASLANEGKIDEAIAKMEEALKAKPDFPAAIRASARLYLRAKNYDKALERANKAIELDPEDTDMHAVLYEVYTAKGDTAKLAEVKKKLPADAGMLFNEAAKLINSGKDKDAAPLLEQAIGVDPKFTQAYYELGMLYVRTGKNADAKAQLEKYLELDPNGKDAPTAKEMLKYVK